MCCVHTYVWERRTHGGSDQVVLPSAPISPQAYYYAIAEKSTCDCVVVGAGIRDYIGQIVCMLCTYE